jgi:hypothetical protein
MVLAMKCLWHLKAVDSGSASEGGGYPGLSDRSGQ